MKSIGTLPRRAWAQVIRGSAAITLASAVASVAIAYCFLTVFSDGLPPIGAAIAFIAPLALAGPSSFFQLLRNEQLRLANKRLEQLASVDWLTDCLNRRAFTSRVADLRRLPGSGGGAFLIIDADHFKAINDRFGHERGDEVLQLLAGDIKAAVRRADVVGRIGGEEFGVFLPGVGLATATEIAERIRRRAAGRVLVAPDGDAHLSVSIGGAVFDAAATFTELFRAADQRLYLAKGSGRDLVRLTELPAADDLEVMADLAFG
jgi:diguanylate cyclase (GGDEF)-like protein